MGSLPAGLKPNNTMAETSHLARQATPRPAPLVEPLWLEWATLGGLLLFAGWLLGVRGVWALLFQSDPTGLTLVISCIFAGATLWCGGRARVLQQQRQLVTGHCADLEHSWSASYRQTLARGPQYTATAMDLLLEQTHGPHGAAWWVNGLQLKLGLLGKVIGFSMLALQIGQMQSFDPAQSQELLRSLTSGLGVALLTTMVGLVGNVLLGLQLTRLDRYADSLVAEIQRQALSAPSAVAASFEA